MATPSNQRKQCANERKIVVLKIGSASLMSEDGRFVNVVTFSYLVKTVVDLRGLGFDVVLVSSGAVSLGCRKLGIARPSTMSGKQAAAAVGQSDLMRLYEDFFGFFGQPVAQILLTMGDVGRKHHCINVQQTFRELLRMEVVPIVNENDTVAVEELKFGDNDTLSARVASLIDADWLILMTDVDGLYTKNPKEPGAEKIPFVECLDKLEADVGGAGSGWGTGGMFTKIQAARIASSAGVRTVVTLASRPQDILTLLEKPDSHSVGTTFAAVKKPLKFEKRWLVHAATPSGALFLDEGAVKALKNTSAPLYPVGVTQVMGDFFAQSIVIVAGADKKEIARGLINFSSAEAKALLGKKSHDFETILGYVPNADCLIYKENLLLTGTSEKAVTEEFSLPVRNQGSLEAKLQNQLGPYDRTASHLGGQKSKKLHKSSPQLTSEDNESATNKVLSTRQVTLQRRKDILRGFIALVGFCMIGRLATRSSTAAS
eukprot:g34590.t1